MSGLQALGELLGAAACARADRYTIDTLGIPSVILMERAALAVATVLRERFFSGGAAREVVVLAGPGNNGGDGLAAARQLHGWGIPARVHLCCERFGEATGAQIRLARAVGVEVQEGVPTLPAPADAVIVDALLGTGSTGAPRGSIASAVEWLCAARGPRLAIDIPTGVDPDRGEIPGIAARVAVTVTIQRSKPGLHITPGRDHAGEVVVAEIGLVTPPRGQGALEAPSEAGHDIETALIAPWAARALIAHSESAAHKGERGHVGVIGGSAGTPGAAILAATAALRAGAGLVTVAALEREHEALIVGARPELMVEHLPRDAWGERPLPRAEVVIVGPGLTQARDRQGLAALWRRDPRPMVWDASALAEIPLGETPAGPRILTPHPGEARDLLGRLTAGEDTTIDPRGARRRAVTALARGSQAVVVLKGAGTLVATEHRLAIAITGGPALATAGTGDCLTGIIAALIAGGAAPFAAACAGVHLHGLAGELAGARPGALALDVAESIGAAREAPLLHRRWPGLYLG